MSKLKSYLLFQSLKVMSVTFLGRLLGLLRDISYSFVFGTSSLFSIFLIVFSFPNLFRRIFGEGALASVLVPFFSDYERKSELEGWKFLSITTTTILRGFLLFCLFLSVLFLILAFLFEGNWSKGFLLAALISPYAVFICFAGILSSILNYKKVFFLSDLSFVFLNIFLIVASFLSYFFYLQEKIQGFFILIIFIFLAGIIQTLFLFFLLKKKFSMVWEWKGDKKSLYFLKVKRVFYPAAFSHIASQLGVICDRLLALFVGTYAVAALYFAERLMAVAVGIFAVPLAKVSLPLKSKFSSYKQEKGIEKVFFLGVQQLAIFVFPSLYFFFFYGEEVLRVFFVHGAFDEKSLAYTLSAYYFYMPATLAFSLVYLLRPIFYSKKNTKIMLKIDWVCFFVNLFFGLALIPFLEHNALALSTTLAAFLRVLLLFTNCPVKIVKQNLIIKLIPITKIALISLISSLLIFYIFPLEYKERFEGIFNLIIIFISISVLNIALLFIVRKKEMKKFFHFLFKNL